MWIPRKEYKDLIQQIYTADIVLKSYEQTKEEVEHYKWKLTSTTAKLVQQEQENRRLLEEIDRLKCRNRQLEDECSRLSEH